MVETKGTAEALIMTYLILADPIAASNASSLLRWPPALKN